MTRTNTLEGKIKIKLLRVSCFAMVFFFLGLYVIPAQHAKAQRLQKIRYNSQEEIKQLREVGAEIIVQEDDYVIVRYPNNMPISSDVTEPIKEEDLVQRLVHIHLKDTNDIQKVVNMGVDVWKMKDGIVIASALDFYIEKLREAGFTVEVIAKNVKKWKGKNE